MVSCFPEQDVEPVDPVSDNPKVTITPKTDLSSVREGDVVEFEISVDKMIQNSLSFSVVVVEGSSSADDHDFITDGATLAPFSRSTSLVVAIPDDEEEEGAEQLVIQIIPDYHWDWQVHPDHGRESISFTIDDP